MLNGKRRWLAAVLAVVLVFSVTLTACGKVADNQGSPSNEPSESPSETGGAPGSADKSYKVGINTWGSGVPILDLFGDEAEYAVKLLGSAVLRASDDFTADKQLQNIQNFCGAGVDGIVMQASAASVLPQMAQVCLDKQTPFVLNVFIGDDPDRDKIAAENPYYVGAVDSDMVYDGRVIGEAAIADGCKTALIIGGNIGDNNMAQRTQGFKEAFEAGGGTILQEARCTDPSESPVKAADMVSAYQDADCIYALVGDYVPASVDAVEKLGLTGKMKIYMSCVDATSAEYIKDGRVALANDGIGLSALIAPTLLLNYLDGHPIKDSEGLGPRFRTIPFIVNKDNVDEYLSIFYGGEGVHPISDEIIKSLCWRYNPDVTYQTYVDLINNNLTLDALLESHGLPKAS